MRQLKDGGDASGTRSGKAGGSRHSDHGQACRIDILPRELVREAMLIAAHDELSLSTRDQVTDDTVPEVSDAGSGAVEVISFSATTCRGNRSALGKAGIESLLSHETPTSPAEASGLTSFSLARGPFARGLSQVLKTLGGGETDGQEERGGLRPPGGRATWQPGICGCAHGRGELHKIIGSDGNRRLESGRCSGLCLARGSEPTRMAPGTQSVQGPRSLVCTATGHRDPRQVGALAPSIRLGAGRPARRCTCRPGRGEGGAERARIPETPAWVDVIDAFVHYDAGRLAAKSGPKAKLAGLLCMLTLTPTYPPRLGSAFSPPRTS